MSEMLNRLVAESINREFPDADSGHVFQAQKELEKIVVEEICTDRASEIDEKAKKLGDKRRFEAGLHELRTVLVQCFILAFLVGLLVNHVYDALKVHLYTGRTFLGIDLVFVGGFVLLILCVGIAVWMVLSKMLEFVQSMSK